VTVGGTKRPVLGNGSGLSNRVSGLAAFLWFGP